MQNADISGGFPKVPGHEQRFRAPLRWATLVIGALSVCVSVGRANAFQVAPYLESSDERPKGGIGISFQDAGLRLRAGLKVEVEDGYTETLPQLSSAFAMGEKLDIQTSVNLPDWNSGIDFSDATFDTRFRLRFPATFITRLDARIRRLAKGVSHDTSVYFRSPASFFDHLEGRFRQSADGAFRNSLNLQFSDRLNAANAEMPFTVRGRATLEKVARPNESDAVVVGMEAVVSGIIPRDLGGVLSRWRSTRTNHLILRFEREAGGQESYAPSLAYDHAWSIREATEIDLSLKVHEVADELSSSLEVTWQAQF